MTSSPGPMPSASRSTTIASVPLATPTARVAPRYSAASSSKERTFSPRMNWPRSNTSSIRFRISPRSGRYCALGSVSGMGTAGQSTQRSLRALQRPPPCAAAPEANRQIGDRGNDERHDRVVGIAPALVEALPTRAEREPRAGESEAPGQGPEKREDGVADDRHLGDPGRYRDERADHGHETREEDGSVTVAPEPCLGALEPVRGDVHPASVPLEERSAPEIADAPAEKRAEHVTEHPRERHRHVGPCGRLDRLPEERHLVAREGADRDRARIEHHELARRSDDGVDEHQQDDRIQAVVADRRGHGVRYLVHWTRVVTRLRRLSRPGLPPES